MAGVREFQERLLADPQARREFADNPAKVLEGLGVTLPAGTDLPASIPLDQLEEQVAEVNAALKEQGKRIADIDASSTPAVTRFVEDAVPLRTREIRGMEAIHDEFATDALRAGRNPGDVATVAVVGAVVAAVVAVPVAVFGFADRFAAISRPEMGIQAVSSRARGLTVHGPAGLRLEGASVDQVADLIETLQQRCGGNIQ